MSDILLNCIINSAMYVSTSGIDVILLHIHRYLVSLILLSGIAVA